MKSRSDYQALVSKIISENVPFNRVLGVEVASSDPAKPQLRFAMRPDLIGNSRRGILHGGVISAVLDVTAGFAIMLALHKDSQPGEKLSSTTEHTEHTEGFCLVRSQLSLPQFREAGNEDKHRAGSSQQR